MRLVADTNIVLSAFLWGGKPLELLNAARQKSVTLFTSATLITELEDVLSRDKFAARIASVGSSPAQMLDDYLALATMVRPTTIAAVARDPDDDHVIACAIAATANAIVTRDEDLLSLKEYRGIAILTVAQLLPLIADV
jgi:uncharacterized protein